MPHKLIDNLDVLPIDAEYDISSIWELGFVRVYLYNLLYISCREEIKRDNNLSVKLNVIKEELNWKVKSLLKKGK